MRILFIHDGPLSNWNLNHGLYNNKMSNVIPDVVNILTHRLRNGTFFQSGESSAQAM